MTGIAMFAVSIFAAVKDSNRILVVLSGCFGFLALFWASYKAWSDERHKLDEALAIKAFPKFIGHLDDVIPKAIMLNDTSALGTQLHFTLFIKNDGFQKSGLRKMTVAVADVDGKVYSRQNPTLTENGKLVRVPLAAMEQGDARQFEVLAEFAGLDYDKVNDGSVAVRLSDSIFEEDHFIYTQ
jgi:hypothetical protein